MIQRKSDDELIEKTNEAISELVYPKVELQKAYNYYNGIRDAEQFKYLEENFGIGNPTSVEFTPLIKKHIDALIGEYLGTPILPKVTCKDKDTISNINRERQLHINSEIHKFLQNKIKNQILSFIDGKDITDKNIEQQINTLIADINENFTSEYEIAAQNVIEYLMQSRHTDIINKLRHLILDLLISGYTFYRCRPSSANTNVEFEVLDPRNVFPDRNFDSPYVKDSYRIVVRHWLTKTQVLNRYGRELSKDDIATIKENFKDCGLDNSSFYIRNYEHNGIPATAGLYAGEEVVPGYPHTQEFSRSHNLIPVYEVEWLETDSDFVMQRYETVRIGDDIYILKGLCKDVIRSQDNPDYCSLSVNGIYYVNRTSAPYSLVKACMPLQDKYDILLFYRDNLIANSGTVGDWIDQSLIPADLGTNFSERLQKWLAYKKGGIGLLDTAQEGRLASGQAPMNTIFNGFDDTVKVQAVQAIQLAIESVEATASSITGVFRERLNGIQQHDAVSNIKMGAQNSFIITKQYYQQMDSIVCEMLMDALNVAKKVYKNGLTGTIILGDKYQKIFTALSEHFTMSDHDIHITTSTDVMMDIKNIQQIIPDFIKSGSLAPDIIFEALTAKSMTDLKKLVKQAMAKQKAENNQIQQLTQQGEELNQQLQEAQKQLQAAQKKIQQYEAQRMQLEQNKIQMQHKVDWFKAQTDRTYKENEIENDKRKLEVELFQLNDGNPYNDAINHQ